MFNKGDFIVCIDNNDDSYKPALTIWKQYEVFDVRYDGVITILDDDNGYGLYSPHRFITIAQAREEKLNKLIWKK